MQTSQNGIDLIKSFEGCRLTAYEDSGGLPTIGYGHTCDVQIGTTITQKQSEQFLAEDLQKFEKYVNDYATISMTQHQFDALVSFTYNLGPNVLHHSRLLTALNAGNIELAANGFLDYDHAGGEVVAGLTRRRQAERELFLTPDKSPEKVADAKSSSFLQLIKDMLRS